MTDRAFLGSISRINADQGHTSYGGLVVDILPELIEAPVMLFAPLSLWNRYPLSYARKIFQHDSRRGVYGLRNQLLRDAMINVSMEPSFFTGKLLQMTFCAICSTALKIGFEVIDFGSNLFNLLTRELFTRRIYCNILDSKINTKNILRNKLLWLGNIDHNTKIECPILEDEIRLTSDSVKPWSMVITDHDRQLNSAIERQQGYPIESLPGHDSLIIDNSSIGIKFGLNGLISLVGFAGLGYGPNSHLSRDAKHFPNITINNLLQFDFVGCMEFKSLFPYVIAGGVELMHSLKERTVIFSRGIQFDFEGLHHCIDNNDPYTYRTFGIPPHPEGRGLLPN